MTDVQGSADADVKSRIGKARQALFYIIEANMDFKKDLSWRQIKALQLKCRESAS